MEDPNVFETTLLQLLGSDSQAYEPRKVRTTWPFSESEKRWKKG